MKKYDWFTDDIAWNNYQTMMVLSDASYACMIEGNRDGWYLLCRAMGYVAGQIGR